MLPVLIISLASETERRVAMSAHLQDRGFHDITFLDAVDGRQMDINAHPFYDGPKRRRCFGRDMKPGELGCMLSHRAAYQYILDHNRPHMLVLEDDARLGVDAKAVLDIFLAKNLPYEMVRLFGSPKTLRSPHRKIIDLTGPYYLARFLSVHGEAHATLISRAGAEKLLAATTRFYMPIDLLLGRSWENGTSAYAIHPALATQDKAFDSAIGEGRFHKDLSLSGTDKIAYKIHRPLFKIKEALAKRHAYARSAAKDLAASKDFL